MAGDTMSPTEHDADGPEERYDDGPAFRARTAVTDDGTIECTIYPVDAPADSRTTRWLSAKEGSYVGLDEMR